ncbi:hypothetical protein [Longimicrobium sp.]|uniref:hypothetical protein n=1 Tax=Longimicrobium sp. TaxID=2029185 RepID=UPI002D7ECB43|nr:hypothetical protein [Longimicrobium sp.]
MLLAASGCEQPGRGITMTAPPPKPLRLATPTQGYHLDAAARAKVPPGIDASALERLLASVVPERRDEILAYFQVPPDRPDRGYLMRIDDPELQAILEEVWAPMWDHAGATDAQLAEHAFPFPGREIALARRAAARDTARH